MLVQIYGVTSASDAEAVDQLGADLIGVVVYEGIATWDSVDEKTARAIIAVITQARVVALSLSIDRARVEKTAELLQPAVLHLARAHLMESPVLEALRAGVDTQLMLTVPVGGPESLNVAARLASVADYLLLDSTHPQTGVVGATGLTHNWELSAEIVKRVRLPVLLAGGLGPHNVRLAIDQVRPAGVDSETHTSFAQDRRRKDLDKVRSFIKIAKASSP